MEKMRSFIGKGKLLASSMAVSCMLAMMAVTCFAEGEDSVGTVMSTTATTIITDLKTMVTTVLPIALGLFTLVVGIKFGIKFIKQMVGKAG